MKGMESIMLAAIVALLGVGIWRAQRYLPGLRLSAVNSISHRAKTTTDKQGASEATKSDEQAHKHGSQRTGSSSLKARGGDGFVEADGLDGDLAVVEVPTNPPFPSSEKLAIGTTRPELRIAYGAPDLQVAAMRNGSLFEEYYYFNSDRTRFTLAILEDGRLVSAETKSH